MANFNAMQIGVLIRALNNGGTAEHIAQDTGYNINTIYRYIRTWHKQRIVFVEDWYKGVNDVRYRARWKLRTCLAQDDAPKPKPISRKEKTRRYLQRKVQMMVEDALQNERAKRKPCHLNVVFAQ